MFWLFAGAIFSTLGGLLGSAIFKKPTPPGTIDVSPSTPALHVLRTQLGTIVIHVQIRNSGTWTVCFRRCGMPRADGRGPRAGSLGPASGANAAGSRPGQMPTLPLTQLDERAPSADLDNRTFTLTFAQAVPVRDLLLLLVAART